MDKLEIYLLLFTDSLVSNLVFDGSAEIAVFSMKVFSENYNPTIVVLVATLASVTAFSANYLLGIACFKILSPMKSEGNQSKTLDRIEFVKQTKLLPFILLLSGIPFFGKFIILFAGFCRISFSKVLLIGTTAKFFYYIVSYVIL